MVSQLENDEWSQRNEKSVLPTILTVLLLLCFRVVELLLDLDKPPKTARHTAPTEACYTRDSEWILHDSCNSQSPVLDEAGNLPNKPRNHLVLVYSNKENNYSYSSFVISLYISFAKFV